LSSPLLSRFFIVELEPYTYEQFCEISNKLLSGHKVEAEVASVIANTVWSEFRNIRDCVKIGTMAKTIEEDVDFLADMIQSDEHSILCENSNEYSTYFGRSFPRPLKGFLTYG